MREERRAAGKAVRGERKEGCEGRKKGAARKAVRGERKEGCKG